MHKCQLLCVQNIRIQRHQTAAPLLRSDIVPDLSEIWNVVELIVSGHGERLLLTSAPSFFLFSFSFRMVQNNNPHQLRCTSCNIVKTPEWRKGPLGKEDQSMELSLLIRQVIGRKYLLLLCLYPFLHTPAPN